MMSEFPVMSDKKDNSVESSKSDTSYVWRGGGYNGNLKRAFSALCGGTGTATAVCAEVVHEAYEKNEQMTKEQQLNVTLYGNPTGPD